MAAEIAVIITRINQLKIKLAELWDEKGSTDPEILRVSLAIDHLLNQYNRLTAGPKN